MLGILKITISIIIIAICGYIGMYKSRRLKLREEILREMITFLELVKNEIRYMQNPLPNAYEISRQKLSTPLKDVMGAIVVDMLNFNSNTLIENSIIRNVNNLNEITEYDKNVFSSVLKNLGRSDLESQINIIENSIRILDNQIKEANEIKLNNSKVYKTVGVISGIMIVIIFI